MITKHIDSAADILTKIEEIRLCLSYMLEQKLSTRSDPKRR